MNAKCNNGQQVDKIKLFSSWGVIYGLRKCASPLSDSFSSGQTGQPWWSHFPRCPLSHMSLKCAPRVVSNVKKKQAGKSLFNTTHNKSSVKPSGKGLLRGRRDVLIWDKVVVYNIFQATPMLMSQKVANLASNNINVKQLI